MDNLTDDEDFLELIDVLLEGQRRNPRVFRERRNHFHKWNEEECFNRFRVSKTVAREVTNQINIEVHTKRSKSISLEDMMLLILRYYATGSMLIVVGDFSGVHKSTACRIICKVIVEIGRLKNRLICLKLKMKLPKCSYSSIEKPGFQNMLGHLIASIYVFSLQVVTTLNYLETEKVIFLLTYSA